MKGTYIGYVSRHDALHDYLHRLMADRLGVRQASPAFRVFRLRGSNEVYGYEERSSRTRMICKFYGGRPGRDPTACMAHQEYESLETLRGYDLAGSPHLVVRPLGWNREINGVLTVDYYAGEQFSHAVGRAAYGGDDPHLYRRLTALASFLATLHNRTAGGESVDFDPECRYFETILRRLQRRHVIGQWDHEELSWLQGLWRDRPGMWQDRQVWLHGDATPANFIFGRGMDVAAIDLERMKRGDRMFDVGRVAGELQHAFLTATGDRHRADPFIGHFLWEYSAHFPDRSRTFASLGARAPYYMGLNLLRIARNDYIGADYGGRLVSQAKRLLRTP